MSADSSSVFPDSIQSSDDTKTFSVVSREQNRALYCSESDAEYYVAKAITPDLQERAKLLKKAQTQNHAGAKHTARIEDVIVIGSEDSTKLLILCEFVFKGKIPGNSVISWNDGAPSLDVWKNEVTGRWTIWETWGIVSQVAAVIHWFAQHGGHRDIAPQNILLCDDREVVIVDFVNPIASSSADDLASNTLAPDLRALVKLLLYLLGCTKWVDRDPNFDGAEWHRHAKKMIEKQFPGSELDRKQLESAIVEIANNPQAPAKAVEGFLKQLSQAPSISPLPVPFSIGFVLVQSAWLGLLGCLLIAVGLILPLLPLMQWWPPLIAMVTPTPLTVTHTPTMTPTVETPTATATLTPTLSAPVTITVTATAVTPSPTLSTLTLTLTPTPTRMLPVNVSYTPTATPKLISPPLVPEECIANDRALQDTIPFGFIQPSPDSTMKIGQQTAPIPLWFQIRVDGYDYYTIRFVLQGREIRQQGATRIIDWPSIDASLVCHSEHGTGEVRCQRSVGADLTGGVLAVSWNPNSELRAITRNAPYTFLLELERERTQGVEHFCAYISNVRLTN